MHRVADVKSNRQDENEESPLLPKSIDARRQQALAGDKVLGHNPVDEISSSRLK